VQTATKTEPITFNNWTLRVRQSTIENPKVLLMIHGITGDENSMWVFGRKFSPSYLIKHPLQTYFGKPALHMLESSAEALIRLVDEYIASLKVEAHQFDVVGFSQGAAMVSVLGLVHPNRIRKMGVLAGFVPSGLDEYIAQKPLADKKVFVAHGTKDETVTIDRAHEAVNLFQQAGADVTFVEDEVGHKLGSNGMKALEESLQY
jgi:predicted esterase